MLTVPNRVDADRSCFGAVAIVASAGGIPALIELLGGLEATFPLPIFVAQHLPRRASGLDTVLSRRCAIPVNWARPGKLQGLRGVHLAHPGTGIYLSVSGMQLDLLAAPSTSWLASGDRMIQSVFSVFGSRTVAIVLSGMLPAGVVGVQQVRRGGGITMAQNRRSATDFEMPSAAIDFGRAEFVCSPARMAEVLSVVAAGWETDTGEPAW